MPNIIQRFIANTVTWAFSGKKMDALEIEYVRRRESLAELSAYYDGMQRQPLKISVLGKNYNVITNLTAPIVNRSVFALMGGGVRFQLPAGADAQEDEINAVWDANARQEILTDAAQFGAKYGTPFVKIIPNGTTSRDGTVTFRLVALDPANMVIIHAPDDIQRVVSYVFRWSDGETAYREITEIDEGGQFWTVRTEFSNSSTRGAWEQYGDVVSWPYEFPPIAHAKNLPKAGSVYGVSDIEEIISLQDKYNETQSNINKILSLQAWAQKWITGGKWPRVNTPDGKSYIDAGPDKAIEIDNPDAKIGLLQPSGDLASSRQFAQDLRRDIFWLSATTDPDVVQDRIGQITNFGLRVIYANELAKTKTKQGLYGNLISEVNYRLLRLMGYAPAQSDPGVVIFADPLPRNETEEVTVVQSDLGAGIVSKQTAAERRGYDWEREQERLNAEKTLSSNAGAEIIRGFLAGR